MNAQNQPDELTLTIGGQAISGWTDIRITRGIERCPADFTISMTERYPGELDNIMPMPGNPCSVHLGQDLVVTGYIDRFVPNVGKDWHTIQVSGRGKCSDIVDCAAICPTMCINNSTVLGIARKLLEPHGISVTYSLANSLLPVIPQYCVNVTETPWEAISRYAAYSGLLVYELPDGNLILTPGGNEQAASGFVEGQNVQEASVEYSMDQRYSDYLLAMNDVETFSDLGLGEFIEYRIKDPNVPRYRPLILVTDNNNGAAVAKRRVQWECTRRAGRSKKVNVTADSWRDSAGKLWQPNTLAHLELPSLKLPSADFIIGEVTYLRDDTNGTTAKLELMGAASYAPEPVQLTTLPLEFT